MGDSSVTMLLSLVFMFPLIQNVSPVLQNGHLLEGCESTPITPGSSDLSVTCNLRTINSEFDKTNFTSLPGESLTSLNIICSDVLFYQSSLEPGSLAHLDRLGALHVEHCKLSRLPPAAFTGLPLLRNLTIRTHNTAWPALSLDIAKGVFNIPRLERIDLSANNIWTFPDSLFCPATALEYLNISLNRVQDVGDLSFREKEIGNGKNGCKSGLKILDVSSNRLILLPNGGFSNLGQLRELYVQDNEISVISERALGGLGKLGLLNLANNKIQNLPEGLFKETREIAEINLQNNSLTVIPPKLFKNLDQLMVLDLSRNLLTSDWMDGGGGQNGTSTTSGVLGSLVRLVVLNLSHNRLQILVPAIFRELYSLQILNLEYNNLESIAGDTFSALNNLHTLILAHNSLTAIQATTFNGLYVLSLLSVNNNNISRIADNAFTNCSSLKDINLNGNALQGIPAAITNLTVLKTVDLGENSIEQLETPRLVGLPNLYGFRITGNNIVNVSKNALVNLPNLKVLNLARNRIARIEAGAFDANTNLQAVRLDANFLRNISGLFTEARNLIWLNLSDNQLGSFDYSLIPKQLQWLDLHKNEILELGNVFGATDLRLQTLDASFNRISRLTAAILPDSLEMLFLNDNLISVVEPHTFYMKLNLSRVDIFANQIEVLDLSALRLKPFAEGRPLPEFYIGGNPIICDCNMEWLQRINKLDHSRQHPKVMDLESVYCKLVFHREKYYVPLVGADPVQFLCSYRAHCFALCLCCEFDACDCEMTCPANCTCYHDDTWSANIVDCAGKGHTVIPSTIPMDSSEVYLDGNSFPELSRHAFIGRKNLQVLYLNASSISRISNNSFSGLRRLAILHLENNRISELRGYEFEPLESLRELYLQSNALTYIANQTFTPLKMLEVLKLDGNRLVRFSMWILAQNPYLVDIGLGDNPWSCDCDYVAAASSWVQTNVAKLLDASGVNCRLNGKSLSLLYMNGTKCSDITALSGAREAGDSKVPLYLTLLGSAVLFAVIFTSMVVAFCRRGRTRGRGKSGNCFSNFCCCGSNGKVEEREKIFDAYVVYSVKDEVWVNQILAAELSQNRDLSYRLCFHYRDLRSRPYTCTGDAIADAVESSKRTILVLSKNFLQSEWGQFEFKAGILGTLKGSGRKGRLVAVTLGDFTARDLDPDLRAALRSSTVLSANDKLFWSKLRAALPEPTGRGNGHGRHCASQLIATPVVDVGLGGDGGPDLASSWNGMNFPPLNGHNHSSSTGNGTMTIGRGNSNYAHPVTASSMYVPAYPPPNRPPPPFPTFRRPPPPAPLWG